MVQWRLGESDKNARNAATSLVIVIEPGTGEGFLMKQFLGLKNAAFVVGVAFLLSGAIKYGVRGAADVDLIVGALFLLFGIVVAAGGKGSGA